jgi:uncharacterized protein (DUF169 family)
MSAETGVTLYFVGKNADEAVKGGEAFLGEREAQESVQDGEKVFKVNLTVFSSRVKEIASW